MALFLVFLLLCLPLVFLLSKAIVNKSRSNNPPGPPPLPFIGNLLQIDYSNLHTSLCYLSKIYGPIVFLRLGLIPTVVVSSAGLALEVLKTQDLIFCSRPMFLGPSHVFYNGLGVAFSPHNENWREMKKILTVYLLGPKKVQSVRRIREDEVSSAMKNIRGLALSSTCVNLSELVKNVTSGIIMRVGFGKRYKDGDEIRRKVMLSEVVEMLAGGFVSDLWPFMGLVDRLSGKMDRLEKCCQYFDVFYQELIDEHLNRQNPEAEGDFIDILLRLKKDQLFDLTYNHIKAMLTDVLVGGTETSATTVVWAMTMLIKNPFAMKKAQEEIRNMVGKKGKVDEDDLPKLTYLKAIVKEIMRLYPPIPLLLPRETMKDTILNGYKIKQKTQVFVNVFAIGRDPECWENPDEFLPERFVVSDIEFKGNDFKLIPFGAGRRICPGMLMGAVTVELLLANLIYLFDWGLLDGMKMDFEVLSGLTMHKRNDLCLLPHLYL